MAEVFEPIPKPEPGLRLAFEDWLSKGYKSYAHFEKPGDCQVCQTEQNLCTGEHHHGAVAEEDAEDRYEPPAAYYEQHEAEGEPEDDDGFSLR